MIILEQLKIASKIIFMITKWLSVCFFFLISGFMFAQSGKVFDQLVLKSEILGSDRNFAIYLPPDYETSSRSYPVLYLLHGMGDDQTGWIQFGEVLRITDNAIMTGTATPMVIVMPDANTERIGYFNSPDNEWRYEDFFFDELMPFVEKEYNIISGGTDNHCMLIDLRNKDISGKDAENALTKADITVNKNMVPFDDKSPFVTSGIRIGTAAITTRGLKEDDMKAIVDLIDEVIQSHTDEATLESIAEKVNKMMSHRPIFTW